MLLEHSGVFPPVVGGVLDAETVWGVLLPERFGLASGHPDLISLLQGTAERDLAGRWKACTPEFRKAATAWIGETAGDAAGAILYAAETATQLALDAIQILGGNGYINDYPTGRLLRDAKLYEIGAGTSEIRRWLIGRELFAESA